MQKASGLVMHSTLRAWSGATGHQRDLYNTIIILGHAGGKYPALDSQFYISNLAASVKRDEGQRSQHLTGYGTTAMRRNTPNL